MSDFNPLTGEGSPGRRLTLTLSGIPAGARFGRFLYHTQRVPTTMRDTLPGFDPLLAGESLHEVARTLAMTPDDYADMLFASRCAHDFPFWAATVVRIKPKGGGDDIPFVLNYPQRRLVEAFESMRLAGKPIRLILLKARQWGGSTCTQLYMAWLQLCGSKGLNSLIIAHQSSASEEIKDMFDRMLAAYPEAMLDPDAKPGAPKMKGVGRSGTMRIVARNCKLKIGTAERPDSCRGGDYSLVHLSEVGIWRRTQGKCPEDIVRSACSGVLLRPMTMIVMESTANGTGTFFHREYLAASRGESQFAALFIPWYDIESYRIPLDDEERAALVDRLEAGRDSDVETERSPSGRYLYSLYQRGASPEAIAWYMAERSKYSDQAQMAAEYPSDDVEAFAHSGARVFDRAAVERLRAGCLRHAARGEVVGAVDFDCARSLDDLRFVDDANGGLRLWARPAHDATPDRYLVVVDVGGRSVGADWSVIAVFDRMPVSRGAPPEVVAQWRGHCDMDILAWRAARIAAWYDDALLVIESNSLESRDRNRIVDGEQMPYILLQIKEAYPNLYRRAVPPENMRDGITSRYGFHTNVRTKPAIISHLVRMVRDNAYVERDEMALDELLQYERRSDGSYGAILGAHDDILMTRAIGLFVSSYEMPAPAMPLNSVKMPRRRPATESTLF